MQTLKATFRITTPMFLSGADQKQAELRVPSIKGVLRFWWRALQWGKEGIADVAALKRKEDALFGSSEGGQSKVLLSLETQQPPKVIAKGTKLSATGQANGTGLVGEGARYLGYGLMGAFGAKAGQLERACLAAPIEFNVRLLFKRSVVETEIGEVADSLKLLGICGGLGSRSRRGWGSVTLTSIKDDTDKVWRTPKTIEEYQAKIMEIVGSQKNKDAGAGPVLPEWTAFAAGHSKVVLLQDSSNSPLEALAKMGKDFVFFRGWGHNGKVLGVPREGNFPYDHDLFERIPPRNRNTEHPQRIVFGLPQNYGKPEQDQVIPADTGPKDKWLTRRASPLFFHVHQAVDGDAPIGVLTYLPAIFLPAQKSTVKFGGSLVPLGQNGGVPFWQPAEDFLKRILSADGRHPVTPPLKASKIQFKKTLEVII